VFGDEGAIALADAFKHAETHLCELRLVNNRTGPEGAKALAEAIQNRSSLKYLSLACNEICDMGAVALANSVVQDAALETIDHAS